MFSLVFRKPSRGFSLIEIMVVIAVISILAGVVLVSLNQAREKTQITQAQAELEVLYDAALLLFLHTGKLPNGQNEFCHPDVIREVNLSSADAGLVANGSGWTGWKGPYVESPVDPWGSPYMFDPDYQCLRETVGCFRKDTLTGRESTVLVSCGPNKAVISGGTETCDYDEDNIVLWLCDSAI